MTDDIEERAALARRGVMDHSDCEECTEDWTFLMRQGRREFPLGLRTVLACLAFAEREGAVPEVSMTTMRGEGSRLWMCSRHGREGRKAS